MISRRRIVAPLLLFGLFNIGVACSANAGPVQPAPGARNTAPVTANAPAPTEGPVLAPITPTIEPTIPPPPAVPTPEIKVPAPMPQVTIEPISPAPKVIPTPVPVLGGDYQERLVRAGYSRDISQRIASLGYNEISRRFADEILLIGEKAGYAREEFVKRILPLLEDRTISNDELIVVSDIDEDGLDNATEVSRESNVLDKYNRLPLDDRSAILVQNPVYGRLAVDNELTDGLKDIEEWLFGVKQAEHSPYVLQGGEFNKEIFSAHVRHMVNLLKRSGVTLDDKEAVNLALGYFDFRYNLWRQGKSAYPLDRDFWVKQFPNKEDREAVFAEWVPVPTSYVNLDFGIRPENVNKKEFDMPNRDDLVYNLSLINKGTSCGKFENKLTDPKKRVLIEFRADSYSKALGNFGDWYETGIYASKIDELLKTSNMMNKMRLIFGYVRAPPEFFGDTKRPILGQDADEYAQIIAASCGGFLGRVRADYPDSRGVHESRLFFVPQEIVSLLLSNRKLYGDPVIARGQGVNFYTPSRGLRIDHSNEIPDQERINMYVQFGYTPRFSHKSSIKPINVVQIINGTEVTLPIR